MTEPLTSEKRKNLELIMKYANGNSQIICNIFKSTIEKYKKQNYDVGEFEECLIKYGDIK